MSLTFHFFAQILFLLLSHPGVLLAQKPSIQDTAQNPVEVTGEEVDSHRIGTLQPIPLHLVGGPSRLSLHGGFPISMIVVVGPDGSIVSIALSDEMDLERADPDVPKQWISEFKKVFAEAESEVRTLRYRPFQRNGHAVFATFEEDVPCVPPDMLPGPHVNFPEVHNWSSLQMYLERTGCLGMCPSYSIEVHGDGTVFYNGNAYVAVLGQHRGKVSQEGILSMLDAFRAADFFSLRDSYRMAVTDNPTFTISIRLDSHSKKVVDYEGREVGMPSAVTKLEDTIDQLADSARWTKGDSATVEALEEEHWDFTSHAAADTFARVVMSGSADAVREFIAAGVPLSGHDNMGDSPLGRAAYRGDPDILRSILQSGSNPSMSDALSQAATAGNLDAVKMLIESGANPNARLSKADPPLVAAASSGIPAVVEEILNYHPDISARGVENRTALIAAVDAGVWIESHKQQVDRLSVVRLLLSAGATVDARDDKGSTALIKNAWDPEIAAILLQHGADINASNKEGWTPLFSASSADLVCFLLQHGANLSFRNQKGETALQGAKQYGNKEVIAVLKAAEAGENPCGSPASAACGQTLSRRHLN
jgi:ankyrin repeat protein